MNSFLSPRCGCSNKIELHLQSLETMQEDTRQKMRLISCNRLEGPSQAGRRVCLPGPSSSSSASLLSPCISPLLSSSSPLSSLFPFSSILFCERLLPLLPLLLSTFSSLPLFLPFPLFFCLLLFLSPASVRKHARECTHARAHRHQLLTVAGTFCFQYA